MTKAAVRFTLVELMIVLTILAILITLAAPNVIESRKYAHQGAAIGALRTIHAGQTLFRESDRENDDRFDYGSLLELSQTRAISDVVLGNGTKLGYTFQTGPASATSEFLWYAVANPVLGGVSADLYFATNHRGLVFYTVDGPLVLNTVDSVVPATMLPLNGGGS